VTGQHIQMTLTELHLNPRRTETAGAAWAQFPGLSDCGAGVAAHLSYLSFPSSLVCICLFIYLLIFENTVFKSHHRAPCVGGSNMGMHHLSSSNQVRVSVGQVPSEGPREKSGRPPPRPPSWFLEVPGNLWHPWLVESIPLTSASIFTWCSAHVGVCAQISPSFLFLAVRILNSGPCPC
jgi:hypothetical protein